MKSLPYFYAMVQKDYIKPTESELEILQILWDKKQATVRQVHEVLSAWKNCGYTTTLKLMQIMFEKGLVTRDDSRRVHIYQPNLNKDLAETQLVGKMVNGLFGGSPGKLIMRALGTANPTREEIEEIKQMLNRLG